MITENLEQVKKNIREHGPWRQAVIPGRLP